MPFFQHVHLGLDVVAGTGVPLGLIAVGTGNDFARHLGLPAGDVGACAQVIIEDRKSVV